MRAQALFTLSARSVGRNARRSILTSTAMALGLALLMFTRALADGGHEQWIDSAVRLGTGHVAIQAPQFLETGRLEHRLDARQVERIETVLDAPGPDVPVKAWAPHLTVNGLASSAASALPVRIEGVDPARERVFSTLVGQLEEGRYLEPDDRLAAYIGVELARRLQLKPGNRMVITAQTASGEVEGQLVRVVGTFRTAIQEIDEGLIHIPLSTARSWLDAEGDLTTVAILLDSSFDTDRAVSALSQALDGDAGVRVLGWRKASPELDSAVRIDDYGGYVFNVILFAIIALAILNSVLMAVLGRRREFGILQALGLTGPETGLVVFGEGLFLTAASGLAGLVLGFAVTWIFFRDGLDFSGMMEGDMTASGGIIEPVIIPIFRSVQVVLSLASILIIGTLASLYPAYRASQLDVAEAMKFEQ